MPYLGNIPATQFAELKYQDFTGGTGTSFTLNDPVGSAQELEVFVNNVRQEPGVAYTVSGTALTMTGSIVASDDFYVVFQGKSTGTATHPASQALTATEGTFTSNVSVTGNVTADGLRLGDGDYAAFGDGLDLQILHSGTGSFITDAGTGDLHIRADNNLLIQDAAGSTNRMAVNSTGVGIGTSNPSHLLDATVSSGSATARFGTTHNSGDNDGTVIISNGGSGDAMLRFDYEGSNTDRARIGVTASGQQLEFYTAGDNERMRIDSSGNVLMGTSADLGNGILHIDAGGSNNRTFGIVMDSYSGAGGLIEFNDDSNTRMGLIDHTVSAVRYLTTSDHRLKENVVAMTGAIDRVKALAPKRFNFIADADTTVDGFLAHEAQTVVPEAVTGTHNEVDDDGNAVMQGIDQSKLIPLLTAALKESITKIETLETENSTQATQIADLITRVTALEDA